MNSEQLARSLVCNDLTIEAMDLGFKLKAVYHQLAELHETNAKELLISGNVDGYIDLFAAIASWEEVDTNRALKVIEWARIYTSQGTTKSENMSKELDRQLDGITKLQAAKEQYGN